MFDWRAALDALSTRDPYSADYWSPGPGQEWYFRFVCGCINIGHADDFDRWSNSVLLSLRPPTTERAWGKFLRRLEELRRVREPDRPGRKDRARGG